MWFAGIDWADAHHDIVVMSAAGEIQGHVQVAHSVEGIAQLVDFVRRLTPLSEQVVCVVETNQGLLVHALLEAGLVVCPVNPTTLRGYRPLSGVKTDRLDAALLARVGRMHWPLLPALQPDSPQVQELKTLRRDLQGRIVEQTRLVNLVNQLTACLKAYFPLALELFDGLQRRVSLAFLQAFPTPAQARAASVEELAAVLASVQYPHAATKAQTLQMALRRPQLAASEGVLRAKTRLTLALVAQLETLREHIRAYEQAIDQIFAQHPDAPLFASLPGAGRRLAPRLLAEWGEDRARYTSAASVQAVAGTAPVVYQSGAFRGVRRRVACINFFRQTLFHFARESVLLEDWAKAFYQRKRDQGKTRAMALRALANHWVRMLYAMWTHRTQYDPAIFLSARQAHGAAT
jgi:transposase